MLALYVYLRGVYCGGKMTDVTRAREKPIMHRASTQCRTSDDDEELTPDRIRNWFPGKTLLEIGDPSRNVIEKIFRSTTDTTRCSVSIKQVLKLNNSRETVERFEKFREEVKNRDYKQCHKHPRNTVDGNEQLLFYGTKLTWCKQFGTSKLCRDSNCNMCGIIKSGFSSAKKKTGIWLTTNCQDSISANANSDIMNVKMAVMVCRVIAGRVIDKIDSNNEGDYDSIEGIKPNYLFVRNPSAVLPCFVIILNC